MDMCTTLDEDVSKPFSSVHIYFHPFLKKNLKYDKPRNKSYIDTTLQTNTTGYISVPPSGRLLISPVFLVKLPVFYVTKQTLVQFNTMDIGYPRTIL